MSSAPSSGRWNLSFGYRWQDSFRHFVGDVEQPQRVAQDTQQENKIHLFDVALSYRLNRRWTLTFSAPAMDADRINHRTKGLTESTGLGDMSVGAKFWVFRPPTESHQNIQVGFSIKLPTGKPNATSLITGTANPTNSPTTVDQSIQLGDSATGFAIDYMAYKSLPRRFTLFSTGVYLFNPKNTYTATTPGARALSVPDQYLFRGGLGYGVPKLRGVALSAAGRVEGVPARDLIGREDGFRRPGYAVSVEPGLQYARGRNLWSFSYAIAVHRDRTRSVPDVRAGTHGDAAFADSVLLIGYSRIF
ncbi:MAG: hypothetical protein NTW28_04635 [Candidatus Solibacter sp.]|nr:hypothetical protein [Candidatus Solibacter sp.]